MHWEKGRDTETAERYWASERDTEGVREIRWKDGRDALREKETKREGEWEAQSETRRVGRGTEIRRGTEGAERNVRLVKVWFSRFKGFPS